MMSVAFVPWSSPAGIPAESGVKLMPDLCFAEVPERKLWLDLYLPKADSPPPLVVFIHGGGWKSGDRKESEIPAMVARRGYAVASLEYRYSSEAVFPAQIYDCKGAVRWLRAHAGAYGYDASSIAVIGCSAGGHLALLLGTSGGEKALEGEVGGNLDQSSRVQAIVDFYGPADFVLRSQDQPEETEVPGGKAYDLLGCAVKANLEKARFASGVSHVTPDDPPLLVFHGTEDRTVLMNQSEKVVDVYRALGLPVTFQKVEGGAHGGPEFVAPAHFELLVGFLDRYLRGR